MSAPKTEKQPHASELSPTRFAVNALVEENLVPQVERTHKSFEAKVTPTTPDEDDRDGDPDTDAGDSILAAEDPRPAKIERRTRQQIAPDTVMVGVGFGLVMTVAAYIQLSQH